MSVPRGYPRGGNRQGTLVLTLEGSRLGTNVNVPRVRVDGQDQEVRYGENTWLLRAGPHRVQVEMFYVFTYGRASCSADVAPDQVTRLFYVPPHHQLAPAGLGPTSQPRTGGFGAGFLVLIGVALLLLGLVLALA